MLSLTDPSPAPPPPPGSGPRPLTLWCGVCGQSQKYTPEQMLRLKRDGWPRCCGQVMGFFSGHADPPGEVS